jgi:tetratricopeptide (TPR) repeat protein
LLVLGNAYLGKGMMEEAIKTHEELVEVAGPLGYFWLGPTYLATGKIDEGKKILEELEKMPVAFYTIAKVIMYTQLGDFDKAFEAMEFEPRHAWFPWIRIFPLLEPLREDPRFKEIMRELNLPDPTPFEYNPALHS